MTTPSTSSLTRRSFVSSAIAAGTIASLASLGITETPKAAYADESGNDTLIYAIAGEPSVSPNGITTSDRYGLTTLKLVYSPLYTYNADGINYLLAESYDVSDDGLVITAHLRENVVWNDGEPFTADDVVFSYEKVQELDIANGHTDLDYGDQGKVAIEKIDDTTVQFTFPFVNAAAPEALAGKWIIPKHLYENVDDFENNEANEQGVGTGPYKLEEYAVGQYLSFTANESYFGGAPSIPRIVLQVVTNENTGQSAIQTGEVNVWIGTPSEIEQMDIEGNGLTVTPYTEGRVAYVEFNANRVSDQNVRKALWYSLDKKAIADAALLSSDYYDLPYTFLPNNNPFYTEDGVEKYERDVDYAKQLLADAGNPNPTFKLGYSGSDSLQSAGAVLIQEQAAEAGITIELAGVDANALEQAKENPDNDYDLYYGGYIMGIDPDSYNTLFRSDGAWNFNYAGTEQIDDLFDQGRIQTDETERQTTYAEIQRQIADLAAFYPLYSNKRLLVTTSNVGGIDEAKTVPIYTFEDWNKLTLA